MPKNINHLKKNWFFDHFMDKIELISTFSFRWIQFQFFFLSLNFTQLIHLFNEPAFKMAFHILIMIRIYFWFAHLLASFTIVCTQSIDYSIWPDFRTFVSSQSNSILNDSFCLSLRFVLIDSRSHRFCIRIDLLDVRKYYNIFSMTH